jgi:hypothetical protein
MTKLTNQEIWHITNFLEYKLYMTPTKTVTNDTTKALKKLYINLKDELYGNDYITE